MWSGNTPAGRAAIVTQQAYLHTTAKISSDDMNQIHPLWGFVADVNGKPTVVDDDYDPKGVGLMRGFFAGADRSVLIVLDLGRPMSWSTRVYQPDGRVTRDWHPLPVDGGAAVVRVPPGRDQRTIAVAAGPDYRQSSMIRMGNAWSADVHDVDTRLPWDAAYPVTGPDVTMSADSAQTLCKQLVEDGTIGNDPYAWGGGSPRWCAYGQTPDGRTVEVGDAQLDNDPSHVYFMLVGKGTVQRGQAGPVDPNAALPVIVKLPDAQGWVVARKGALLKYRTANGTWQGGRHNAALLPPAAARVWVDLGDHAVDVPLPG